MIHLMYVSRAHTRFMAEQLQDLLASSRATNLKLGITGMLLQKDGRFLPVLEGAEETVVDLYRHFAVDPRHGGSPGLRRVPPHAAHRVGRRYHRPQRSRLFSLTV